MLPLCFESPEGFASGLASGHLPLPPASTAAAATILLCFSSSILLPVSALPIVCKSPNLTRPSAGKELDLSRDGIKGPHWGPFATTDDDLFSLLSSGFSPQGDSFRVRSSLLDSVGNLVLQLYCSSAKNLCQKRKREKIHSSFSFCCIA